MMTLPRLARLLLMAWASFSLMPEELPLSLIRSLPARSTWGEEGDNRLLHYILTRRITDDTHPIKSDVKTTSLKSRILA